MAYHCILHQGFRKIEKSEDPVPGRSNRVRYRINDITNNGGGTSLPIGCAIEVCRLTPIEF